MADRAGLNARALALGHSQFKRRVVTHSLIDVPSVAGAVVVDGDFRRGVDAELTVCQIGDIDACVVEPSSMQ